MLTIRADEWARLRVQADAFDKTIVRSLRKRIREIGQVGIEAVRKVLAEDPPEDKPGSAGSRRAVSDALRVTVSFTPRGGGAKIVASNRLLRAGHKGFVAAYEKKVLRHPVFGRDVFVEQPTRPYFGASINDALDGRGERELKAAIDDAVRALGGRVR